MNKTLNVLVTGCGGDIGQSIGKILNNYHKINYLIGCDISDHNAGKFIYKNFFIGKPCSDKNYLKSVEESVDAHKIDLIIPIAEPELRFLSSNKIFGKIGAAQIVSANAKALEIGFDKLITAKFLEKNSLPFPKTTLISNAIEPLEFPVIMKSRMGSGSSAVYIVKNSFDYNYVKQKHPNFIIQEYLSFDKGEFTCGLFRNIKGDVIRSIILKRELTGGYSGYGEVIQNREIKDLLEILAIKIDLKGSINVQLRLTTKGPVIFEINPRFSSTVLFRHLFGFQDLIWSIQDITQQEISPYKEVKAGKKFYKGFSEYID
jgi:carbamoyl-phosphate synthase large subunit